MNDLAVSLEEVSKFYRLYDSPKDRLKEALHPFGRKLHREFYALKNVSLNVRKGEILGVVGRNGSGKSTLLKLIAGVIPSSSGRMAVHGKVSAMLELGSGLNPDLDGIQNIYFGGIMLGFTQEEMKARVDEIVAFAEIGDFIRQPLKTYSSGMKARLGFALAISIKPEILVVDEVLSVGDDLFRRKCFTRIEELFKSGCTVFFVSHSIQNVVEICTRAILVDRGEIILTGTPKLVTMYYQKFLYAAAGEQGACRREILLLDRDDARKRELAEPLEKAGVPPPSQGTGPVCSSQAEPVSRQRPFLISGFVPKSTVITQNSDVRIGDFRITTLEGEPVNALALNGEYLYSYTVRFGADVPPVRFGMGIKNEKGSLLSWMSYPGKDRYIENTFQKDESYIINWRFWCLFFRGTYYIDSGLRTPGDGDGTFLVRAQDALAFKVLDDGDTGKGGVLDSIRGVDIKRL